MDGQISEESYARMVRMYQTLKGIGSQLDALSMTIRELQVALAFFVAGSVVSDVESREML